MQNLCRKCRLSVEHFVSSRKTSTEKAKCGVFVFLSRNIYHFFERLGGNGRIPILVPDIWDGFGVTFPSLQLLREGRVSDLG